jgi:hypothetical protein
VTSKRQRIVAVLRGRLEEIKAAGGYRSDLGDHVYVGRVELAPDDELPAATLLPGTPTATAQGRQINLQWPMTVQALTTADPDDPLGPAEVLLADLKQALFRPADTTLGGLAVDALYIGESLLDRDEGGQRVGAQVQLAVNYIETYGDPDA